MAKPLPQALLASLSFLAPGAAPVFGASDLSPDARMFAISATQADRVIEQALVRRFPAATLERISHPSPGFAIAGRYAIHTYTISAHRLPAIGRFPDGSLGEGFRFDVRASGTMPKATQSAVAQLTRDLGREASLIGPSLPTVGGSAAYGPHERGTSWRVPEWLVVAALTLGLTTGLLAGSRLSLLAMAARARPRRADGAPKDDMPSADRPWWNSELLEMTHDAVIVWEMDGAGILYWNYAAEQLYGFDREDAHGKVTHELLRTQLAGSVTDLETKLARYGVWVGELIHTTRAGRRITVEGRLELLSRRDGRWLVLEVNRDLCDAGRVAAARSAMEDRMIRLRNPSPQPTG